MPKWTTSSDILEGTEGPKVPQIRPRRSKTYTLTRSQLKLLSSMLEDESDLADDEEMLELATRLENLAKTPQPTTTFTLTPKDQKAIWFMLNDIVGLYPAEYTKEARTATEAEQTMAIGRAMSVIARKLDMPLRYPTGTPGGAKRYAERTFPT